MFFFTLHQLHVDACEIFALFIIDICKPHSYTPQGMVSRFKYILYTILVHVHVFISRPTMYVYLYNHLVSDSDIMLTKIQVNKC